MTRIILISILFFLTSCKATKPTVPFEKVSNGQDLEKVTLISFDNFFNQWVFNKKKQKIEQNIREIKTDNQFTYFGKPRPGISQVSWTFFKVYTDTLTERFPNYQDFYGEELRDYLWTESIPEEDVELWNYNRTTQQNKIKPNCPYKKNKPIQTYSLIDKTVILTMTWDIKCDELEILKNKTYNATYNLLTKKYENN